MNTLYKYIVSAFCAFIAIHSASGNILLNPSFEDPVQPNLGNNVFVPVTHWTFTGDPGSFTNLVRVNGSPYSSGPDNAQDGFQYFEVGDSGSQSGSLFQGFTLSSLSEVVYGGYLSRREDGNDADGNFSIWDSTNTVQLVTTGSFFISGTASQEQWFFVSGTTTLTPGSYFFRLTLNPHANVDSTFVNVSIIPEPSVVALSLFSIAALAYMRRRR